MNFFKLVVPLGGVSAGCLKSGSRGFRCGKVSSGLPLMSRMMRNRLGSSVSIGLILRATGLYFFPAKMASGVRVSRLKMGMVGLVWLPCRVSEWGIGCIALKAGKLSEQRDIYAAAIFC